MRIAIRADASLAIGSGHVTRTLTLALALRERGHQVRFLSRVRSGNLTDRVAAAGFDLTPLPVTTGQESTWLGASYGDEVEQVGAELRRQPCEVLVVDHYALGMAWERTMRPLVNGIVAIDDLADREHDCELLLDQNLGRKPADYAGLVPPGATMLLGPRFALLREQFRMPHQRPRPRSGSIARLLISMGGFDNGDATSLVLAELDHPRIADAIDIEVVLPPEAPHSERVSARVASMKKARYLGRVDDMAASMERADLAIGAAGTTAWERAAVGLPALIVILAANQAPGARACETEGIARILGELGRMEPGTITRSVLRLLDDPGSVARMAERARSVMRPDEFGTDAVADLLEERFSDRLADN